MTKLDHVFFDLYSLDTSTLTKLWLFTRSVEQQAAEVPVVAAEVEQDHHQQQEQEMHHSL